MLNKSISFWGLLLSLFGWQSIWGQEGELGTVMVSAERMPVWKGCEMQPNPESCTQQELHRYIQGQLQYPRQAYTAGLEGVVTIGCVISKTGEVRNARIERGIGQGCGAEALRIIGNMPLWHPAEDGGETVSVLFHIEVPFFLGNHGAGSDPNGIVYEEPVKPRVRVVSPASRIAREHPPAKFEDTPIGRVYTQASEMPYFTSCASHKGDGVSKKRDCSNQGLVAYMSTNLEYPETARRERIEGIVRVSFIVDEQGRVLNPKVERDIGGGCGEAALNALASMPQWEPGRYKGHPVKMRMSLPLRFFLSSGESDAYTLHWAAIRGGSATKPQLLEASGGALVVRDCYGVEAEPNALELIYEKGSKDIRERSSGAITPRMYKLLKKAKGGGRLTVVATIQTKGGAVEVARIFEVAD